MGVYKTNVLSGLLIAIEITAGSTSELPCHSLYKNLIAACSGTDEINSTEKY